MTTKKVLITISGNDVAPRFDLTTEVLITFVGSKGAREESRTILMAHASVEELCRLILDEKIDVVICGGIEEEFYDYLTWKKVDVLDSVMGEWERALDRFRDGRLTSGSVLFDRKQGFNK